MIGLLSETNSGEEVALLVNSDLFASIEFLTRESEAHASKTKTPHACMSAVIQLKFL